MLSRKLFAFNLFVFIAFHVNAQLLKFNEPCSTFMLRQTPANLYTLDTCSKFKGTDSRRYAYCTKAINFNVNTARNKCYEWKNYCSVALKKAQSEFLKTSKKEYLDGNRQGWNTCKSGSVMIIPKGIKDLKEDSSDPDEGAGYGSQQAGSANGAGQTSTSDSKVNNKISTTGTLSDQPKMCSASNGMPSGIITGDQAVQDPCVNEAIQKNASCYPTYTKSCVESFKRDQIKKWADDNGFDLNRFLDCTGQSKDPNYLSKFFQLKFDGDDSADMTEGNAQKDGDKFSGQLNKQCLRVVTNPQLAQWGAAMKLAMNRISVPAKDEKGKIVDQQESVMTCNQTDNSELWNYAGDLRRGTYSFEDNITFVDKSQMKALCDRIQNYDQLNAAVKDPEVRSKNLKLAFDAASKEYAQACLNNKEWHGYVESGVEVAGQIAFMATVSAIPMVGPFLAAGITATQAYDRAWSDCAGQSDQVFCKAHTTVPSCDANGGRPEAASKASYCALSGWESAGTDVLVSGLTFGIGSKLRAFAGPAEKNTLTTLFKSVESETSTVAKAIPVSVFKNLGIESSEFVAATTLNCGTSILKKHTGVDGVDPNVDCSINLESMKQAAIQSIVARGIGKVVSEGKRPTKEQLENMKTEATKKVNDEFERSKSQLPTAKQLEDINLKRQNSVNKIAEEVKLIKNMNSVESKKAVKSELVASKPTVKQSDSNYPKPVPKKSDVFKEELKSNGIKNLTENKDVVGKRNAGIYRGELQGEPVFVKRLKEFDANQVAMTRLMSDLDIGPDFKGVVTIDGKPSLVTKSIEDGVAIGKFNQKATRELTREQKIAVVEQIENYGKILEKNGIEPTDIEFMSDKKTNKLYIIDVDAYKKLPSGKGAPFAKTEFDAKAKDLRREWDIPKDQETPFMGHKFTPEEKRQMQENDRIRDAAKDGDEVTMNNKKYKVELREDGSKKFMTMSNGVPDGKEWFTTYPNKQGAQEYIEIQKQKKNQPVETKLENDNPGAYVKPGVKLKKFNEPQRTTIQVFRTKTEGITELSKGSQSRSNKAFKIETHKIKSINDANDAFSILGADRSSIFYEGQPSKIDNSKCFNCDGTVEKRNGEWGVRYTDEEGKTQFTSDLNEISLGKVKPQIRINDKGQKVAVLYRTLSLKNMSGTYAIDIMTNGFDSSAKARLGNNYKVREYNRARGLNPRSEPADAREMTVELDHYTGQMPTTSNPVFARTAFGCQNCDRVIVEIEVPVERIVTPNQLDQVPKSDPKAERQRLRNNGRKFIHDENVMFFENEYTYTEKQIPATMIKKAVVIRSDGSTEIVSRP